MKTYWKNNLVIIWNIRNQYNCIHTPQEKQEKKKLEKKKMLVLLTVFNRYNILYTFRKLKNLL